MRYTFRNIILKGFLFGFLNLTANSDVIIGVDGEWRYLKGREEASSPDPTLWRTPGFNDDTWATGRAPFYYENGSGFTGNTQLSDMFGGYSSVYLRHSFDVSTPTAFQDLTLNVQSDDGCIVWLNGIEIARINMPAGEPAYNQSSLPAAGEPNTLEVIMDNPSDYLVQGINVLAIHAFNSSIANSSDFLINAQLNSSIDLIPPEVISILPPPESTVRRLEFIDITFDDAVQGVNAEDLMVNGNPALEMEAVSPRQYVFTVPTLEDGIIRMEWVADHGITDLAGQPNPFEGEGWNITLDSNAPESLVILSEFMADNGSGIRDNFGSRSDWIEIYNVGPAEVDLGGWHLTDDPDNLRGWTFPSHILNVGEFLLVWASGRDIAEANAPFHTDFSLNRDGEFLALVNPDGEVVSAFSPTYPIQRPDISFGRDAGDLSAMGYLIEPTPGSPNSSSGPGFAPDTTFSKAGGIYAENTVEVTMSAPSGTIRYTLNGGIPTSSSAVYTAPIIMNQTTTLRARTFEQDLLPGRIKTANYIMAGNGIANFKSNLPVMIIETGRRNIPQDNRIQARVSTLEPVRGATSLLQSPSFQGLAQIEIRGQTSSGFPKKPYNLEINDEFGADMEVPLLGLPAESDWALHNPYSDKTFMNNFLAYELHEAMGHYAVRRRYVEVFIDINGGELDYPQDYAGLYVLVEKIKIDNNRVDFERLVPSNTSEPEITGGYIVKKDKNSPGDLNFRTNGGSGFSGQTLKFHEPKPREITPIQQAWIRNYLNEFERALYANDWLTRNGEQHYSNYIDLQSFADYFLIVEYAKQIDGYRLSNYMSKDRGEKLKMEPIWDWNLSFGNANYNTGDRTSGWYYTVIGENDHIWMRRMLHGSTSPFARNGDPDFRQAISDRWSDLRGDVLNGDRVIARIDEIATLIEDAAARDFARWPRLGTYVWPNPGYFVSPRSHAGIVSALKTWIDGRFQWMDTQFLKAPTLSYPDGGLTPGFKLTMEADQGTLYYTLDGTDPRAQGGGLASGAIRYTGPVTITSNAMLFARSRLNSDWSGPTVTPFTVDLPDLVLTEIMFDPAPDPTGTWTDNNDFEFIELFNSGGEAIDLKGMHFSKGIQFEFSDESSTLIEPGEFILLVRNRGAFQFRYPHIQNQIFEYEGQLDNQGETLEFNNAFGQTIWAFDYTPLADREIYIQGFSLIKPLQSDWQQGHFYNGTPGHMPTQPPAIPRVRVNEILANPGPSMSDFIELYNPNDFPVDVSGWFISDDANLPKVRLPSGSVLDPKGYLVLLEEDFQDIDARPEGFKLSANGEEAFLFSANAEGVLTGYKHGFRFGASLSGVSIGLVQDPSGAKFVLPLESPTLGGPNSEPRVGPITFSEIMYHPSDVLANGSLWDNTEHEFIELMNISDQEVNLFDPSAPQIAWSLKGGVDFEFEPNTIIVPGERIVVVGFDPTSDPALKTDFESVFDLPANTRLFGPFQGKLANGGERIRLIQTFVAEPHVQDPGEQTYEVVMDEVDYKDSHPWPIGADGLGFSMQKPVSTFISNFPSSWEARPPAPGKEPSSALLPTISLLPVESFELQIGHDLVLSALAQGDSPLQFAWKQDGSFITGANQATLMLSSAQPHHSGEYTGVVYNQHGASQSHPVEVRVVESLDKDNDGIPDAFENLHGLNPADPSDAQMDFDNDGSTNLAEYVAGSDPLDPESFFSIVKIETDTDLIIHFMGSSSRHYRVLGKSDLDDSSWTEIGIVPARVTEDSRWFQQTWRMPLHTADEAMVRFIQIKALQIP